jgi:acyl-CoA thioesterase-1
VDVTKNNSMRPFLHVAGISLKSAWQAVLLRSALTALLLAPLAAVHAVDEPPTKLRDPNVPLAPGEVPDAKPAPTKRAPIDYYAPVTDDPKLPRVLLMGDSVSIAYSPIVRRELGGLANIHRVPANCGATKTALSDYGLVRWLKPGEKWDAIVFNHGLHDASYRFPDGLDKDKDGHYASPARGCQPFVPLADYERNLRTIIGILRKTGAKLLFATTTPIPDSLAEKYVENSEQPYNDIAKKVMQQEGVALVDLWTAVKPEQAKLQGPRNVHFRDEGSEFLGKKVAESLRALLQSEAQAPAQTKR